MPRQAYARTSTTSIPDLKILLSQKATANTRDAPPQAEHPLSPCSASVAVNRRVGITYTRRERPAAARRVPVALAAVAPEALRPPSAAASRGAFASPAAARCRLLRRVSPSRLAASPLDQPARAWASARRSSSLNSPASRVSSPNRSWAMSRSSGDPNLIPDPSGVRDAFEDKWVAWHIVRTVVSTAALACLGYALLLHGRATRPTAGTETHGATGGTGHGRHDR